MTGGFVALSASKPKPKTMLNLNDRMNLKSASNLNTQMPLHDSDNQPTVQQRTESSVSDRIGSKLFNKRPQAR